MKLQVDDNRINDPTLTETGIFVRAQHGNKYDSFDIIHLTKDSLLEWLRSRDAAHGCKSENKHPDMGIAWREQVILKVFRHE